MTARDVDRAADGARGVAEVWGPMLRGKFGARADDIAMVWIWNKLRLRRWGRTRARSTSATRGARGSRCSRRCSARSSRAAGAC